MNQLVPAKVPIEIPYGGFLPLVVPQDVVLRGLVSKDLETSGNPGGGVKIVTQSTPSLNGSGDLVIDAQAEDFCYNYMPLEVAIAQDQILKIVRNAGVSAAATIRLFSDQFIDFRKTYEDWEDDNFDWSGGTFSIGGTTPKYMVKSNSTPALAAIGAHDDIIIDTRVRATSLTWENGVYHYHDVLAWRSDDDASDCYKLTLVTLYNGYSYYWWFYLYRVVSGTPTLVGVLATENTTSPYEYFYAGLREIVIAHIGDDIQFWWPHHYTGHMQTTSKITDTSQDKIDSGSYLAIPDGVTGGFQFGPIDVY